LEARRWLGIIADMSTRSCLKAVAVMFALMAGVGCRGPGTDIILPTRLPMSAPPGQNAGILYDMCTDMGKKKECPQDAVKVGFINENGEVVSERIVRCDRIRKAFP